MRCRATLISIAAAAAIAVGAAAPVQAPENAGAGRVAKKEEVKSRSTPPRIEPSRWTNLAGVSGPACAADPRTRLSRFLAAK